MLWTRFYPGAWILFQDLFKKPHFFLWISFWQKKLQCKFQAFFVISFFCYFVTPMFTYMNSAVLRRKYHCSQHTVWAGCWENTAGWHLSWAVGLIYWKRANEPWGAILLCLCAGKLRRGKPELLTVFISVHWFVVVRYKEVIVVKQNSN